MFFAGDPCTLSIPSINLGKGPKACSKMGFVSLYSFLYHSNVSSRAAQLVASIYVVKRRKQQKLNLFYQIINGEIGISLPDYYHFTNKHARQHYPFYLIILPANTMHQLAI